MVAVAVDPTLVSFASALQQPLPLSQLVHLEAQLRLVGLDPSGISPESLAGVLELMDACDGGGAEMNYGMFVVLRVGADSHPFICGRGLKRFLVDSAKFNLDGAIIYEGEGFSSEITQFFPLDEIAADGRTVDGYMLRLEVEDGVYLYSMVSIRELIESVGILGRMSHFHDGLGFGFAYARLFKNYPAIHPLRAFPKDIAQLIANSFKASFLPS